MLPRTSLAVRLAVLLSLLAGASFVLSPVAAEEKVSAEEAKAEAALKKIEDKSKESSADAAKLRQELAAFRLAHPGTKAAVKAAVLFSELPSPLDKLDPGAIPALEKFEDWQPKDLVGVLGEHRGRHGSSVSAVAFSSDGTFLASGGGPYVRTWNVATMRLIGTGSHSSVTCVALSKDNKTLVSGSSGGSLHVWDVSKDEPPKLRHRIQAATTTIYGVTCHPDNKLVACACYDNLIRVYDVSGEKHKDVATVNGHSKPVRSIAFAPDGKTLVSGSDDETARVWDATTMDFKEKSRIEGLSASVTSVAFKREKQTLATGCSDGSVRLWTYPPSPRPKGPLVAFKVAKSAVTSMSFDKAGTTLATTQGDGSAHLWSLANLNQLKERTKTDGHQGVVTSVAFSPDGKMLATGGNDWTVRTWDATKTPPVQRFIPWSHLSHVYAVDFAPDNSTVASGSYDTNVRFWEVGRAETKTRTKYPMYKTEPAHPVYCLAFSPDGKLIAAGGQAKVVQQWDATRGDKKLPCKNHAGWVYTLCYSPDSKHLLSASEKDVTLFTASGGAEYKRYGPHKTRVHSIGFSPDGKLIVSASGDYKRDEKNRPVMKQNKYVYEDCVVKVWDREKAEEVAEVTDGPTHFYAATFSPDGGTLYAGNYLEKAVRRFSFGSNKLTEEQAWKGASGYASRIWPTPDGKHVLTGGLDGALVMWEAATGKKVKAWSFHEQVGGVAIASDSRHLAVGLGTGVIYLLRLAPAKGKG